MVPTKVVALAVKGLCRDYINKHGVDTLVPERKLPFTDRILASIFRAPEGSTRGGLTLRWKDYHWVSVRACFATLKEEGGRKDEVAKKDETIATLTAALLKTKTEHRQVQLAARAPMAAMARPVAAARALPVTSPTSKPPIRPGPAVAAEIDGAARGAVELLVQHKVGRLELRAGGVAGAAHLQTGRPAHSTLTEASEHRPDEEVQRRGHARRSEKNGEAGGRRVTQCTSLIDLMPTLLDLTLDQGCADLVEPIEGRSLMSLMSGNTDSWADETRAEILFEGVNAPGLMIRRGARKYVHWEGLPCTLFDLESDPEEINNLIDDPAHADEVADFEHQVQHDWPLTELTERVLLKQRRNALVHRALMTGQRTPFDFQPFDDASKRFYRGHGNWHEAEARDFLRFDLAKDE